MMERPSCSDEPGLPDRHTKRIAKNTVVLYIRMLVIMVLTLYTVRVVLNVLGETDYGIYNVVAGVVSMLSFLSQTMSIAVQRFYSYALGCGKSGELNHIFSVAVLIYALLSLVILVLGETLGLWFVNTQLTIPPERMGAANWIYQFALMSFVVTMMSVPFSASIIARENMKLYAYVGIADAVLKVVAVMCLTVIAMDKLIAYGLFTFIVACIVAGIYMVYCRVKFPYCRFRFYWNGSLIREMMSFSGWTLFGSISGVANNQGNNILINIFFGPVVNAARGIAFQVSQALLAFCNNFFTAMRPPLVKSYASGDHDYMMRLFYISNKFIFYLQLLLSLPLIMETEYVLNLWLKEVTEYMVIFTKLTLIYSIITSLQIPVTTIVQATGRVKRYFAVVDSFTLLSLPLTYLFFRLGFPPQTTFIISIVVFAFAHFIRLGILRKLINFRIKDYMGKFLFPALAVTGLAYLIAFIVKAQFGYGLREFIAVSLVSLCSVALMGYLIGLNRDEKGEIHKIIRRFFINSGH